MVVLFSSSLTAASSGQVALPPSTLPSPPLKSQQDSNNGTGTTSDPSKKQPSITLVQSPSISSTPDIDFNNPAIPGIAELPTNFSSASSVLSQQEQQTLLRSQSTNIEALSLTSTTNPNINASNNTNNPIVNSLSLPLPGQQSISTVGNTTAIPSVRNISAGVDQFGIKNLYPTKPGGEEWSIDMENPTADGRFDPKTEITKNPDGSWKVQDKKVRMNVFTSTGYDEGAVVTDHGMLDQIGYMQSPNDWKNVEITGYARVNSGEDDNFAWYARGGFHGDEDPCEGAAYKVDLFYNGGAQVAKEQWHVKYSKSEVQEPETQFASGEWIGFKGVMYNILQPDGKTAVKTENWVDKDGDGQNWIKVYEYTDSGGWGRSGTDCGKEPDQIITWGGPVATFRWDNAPDVDFKNLSIREISVGDIGSTSSRTTGRTARDSA